LANGEAQAIVPNKTNRTWFLSLELCTARFRLNPGDELVLLYESSEVQDNLGAALRTEIIQDGDVLELVVWTSAGEMFTADGRSAPQDFDRA
jgi:hypothetical protein